MPNPIPAGRLKTDVLLGGVKVASPSEWLPGLQDLVKNSTRSGGGRMRANYVDVKRTWQAKWTNLNETEYRLILSKIERRFEFKIACYDPELGWVEKDYYKGDRSFEKLYHYYNGSEGTVTVTFVEC